MDENTCTGIALTEVGLDSSSRWLNSRHLLMGLLKKERVDDGLGKKAGEEGGRGRHLRLGLIGHPTNCELVQ